MAAGTVGPQPQRNIPDNNADARAGAVRRADTAQNERRTRRQHGRPKRRRDLALRAGPLPGRYFLLTDVAADVLQPSDHETRHPDLGTTRWFDVVGLVSFYPEKVTITIDDEKLEAIPGQNVLAHGPDRNLGVDEIGGIRLVVDQVAAEA